MMLRIGNGYDAHAFGPGDHVMLGGVRIPHDRCLEAHSDGDVALHALCDALLGAAALGDIGRHFPPNEERWGGVAGTELVAEVLKILESRDWKVINADLTIICQRPRLAPHVDAMREATARALGVAVEDVSVKATSTDGLGFSGRGEGIAAFASVLIGTE